MDTISDNDSAGNPIRQPAVRSDRVVKLIVSLRKAIPLYVTAGGHPKLEDRPYVLLTETKRDEIVAALSAAYEPH